MDLINTDNGPMMKSGLSKIALCLVLVIIAGCKSKQTGPIDEGDTSAVIESAEQVQQRQQQELADAQAVSDAGDLDTALGMFRDILAENPTLTLAYVGIGDVYIKKKDYKSAEPVFARAARLEPRNFSAQFGHGIALKMLKRFVEAVQAFYRALTIEPADFEANMLMATTRLEMGEPQGALLFAEKAVEIDPASGPARVSLGAAYELTGRNADAIIQYESAIELMDATAPLLLNYINVLAKEKRYTDAKNTAEFLIRIEPSANAYERLGWAHFRLSEFDKSINAYRQAVKLDPKHWPSLNGVGCNALNTWLLSKKRDKQAMKEARDAFRTSLRTNPKQPAVIKLLTDYRL
ncbi:MAG: tetratricopeptide repeat protein [Planctomycetes bacterium]|nr:tetratricopeptide repeat protein [Planctomycetota bacterium]